MSTTARNLFSGAALLCACAPLPTAAAAVPDGPNASPITVIRDDMVYTVAADATYTEEETVKRRINTTEGVQQFGQSYLPFNSSLEDLQVLEAYTIDKDGKRVDVPSDKIMTQQSPLIAGYPMFGGTRLKVIVFPVVEPGAVEFFRMVRSSRRALFPRQFSMVEFFSMDWDHESASITLKAPAALPLHVQAIGLKGGAVAPDATGGQQWTWTLHDVHAEPQEQGMVDPIDLGPRVAATSFPDFAAGAQAYLDGAEPMAQVTPLVRQQAEQITKGIRDPRARAIAIYNWVSQNIRYVSITLGQGGVVPHAADAILAARYGDCKDHAVLLQALLSAVDIASSPVLVNSGGIYWQPDVAIIPGVYDHCITYIPQFRLFVDSTAGFAPFGMLAPTEAGKMALVARGDDGKPALVRLPLSQATRDGSRATMHAAMAADGSVTGTTDYADTGAMELLDRAVLSQLPAGQAPQMAALMLQQSGAPGTGTLTFGDARDLSRPYTFSSSFSLPSYADVPGPGSFSIPVGIPGMEGIATFPRYTALPARKYPFMCFATHKVEDSTLALADGITVKQLPAAPHAANALGHYEATYSQSGRTISVHRELTITPKDATCGPEEYQQLRQLGAVIARDLRAQVIY